MSSHPTSARGNDRLARAAPYALFALLVLAVYADPLFRRRNFAGRDPLGYHLPVENAIHEAYARGVLPVWFPEISGGRPLLANPNAGALYPLRPALSQVPFPLAARIFPVLHWLLAGAGMLLLLRSLGASRAAAWVAAVTFVFCGVSVAEVFYPNIHPGMTMLPWIAWAVYRYTPVTARRVLGLSVLFGLLLLAGDVFTIGLGLLVALLWTALEVEKPLQVRALAGVAAAFALGFLLAAPQWIAAALWIPETNRAVLGMKLDEAFFFSISPLRALELLVPYPFGETWRIDKSSIWGWPVFHGKAMGMFTSLYAGGFAAAAVLLTWRQRTRGARFARVLLLFAAAVSMLPSLTPKSWGSISAPLPLRYPEKLAVAAMFAFAVLAGLGVDALRSRRPRLRWAIVVGAGFALAAGFAALVPDAAGRLAAASVGADPAFAKVAGDLLPFALAEAGLLWMATALAMDGLGRGTSGALAIALVLLTAVPILANRRIARSFREDELFAPTAFARLMRKADPAGEYRTLGESPYRPPSKIEADYSGADVAALEFTRRNWHEYTHALWDRGTVFNYDFDAGDLSRLESLRKMSVIASRYGDSSPFFGGLALRWGVRYRDQDPVPGFRPIGGDALRFWDEHEQPFPDVRLLERWREEPGALTAVNVLPGLGPGEVVLESGRQARGQASPGTVRVRRKDPERLVVETDSRSPTWLFVLRPFWNHRTVHVDGDEVSAVPAQLAFSAVPIPPGRHTVDWRERVPGSSVSRWGPAIYTVVAAALLIGSRRRRMRRTEG